MDEDKINPYLKYFVKESQPTSYEHLHSKDNNSRQDYEEVLVTTESKALYRAKHRMRKRKMDQKRKINAIKKNETNAENSEKRNILDVNNNILFKAITHENVEYIEQILRDHEIDVNMKDKCMWTPLMCACHRGDVAIVELLLNKGASIHVKDMAGNGPLSIATKCNHANVFELLQKQMSEQYGHRSKSQNPINEIPKTLKFSEKEHNSVVSRAVIDYNEREPVSLVNHFNNSIPKKNLQKESVESKIVHSQPSSSSCSKESTSHCQSDTIQNNSEEHEVICIDSSDSDDEHININCDLCDMEISETNYKEHLLSTIHQFYKQLKAMETNEGKLVKPVNYGIPEENIGFQLLLKSGWTKQSGLGKSKSGIRAPIKTKMKNDRKGIGKKKKNESGELHGTLPELNMKFNPRLRKEIEKKKELMYRNELN
uniref:G patch domain and ankyrin repeat-containing protein 1 homolog n=2 Tax=Cacopsylla melanoneura TaxID=428564 RepID=A0A8D8M113_9HEMI